MTTTNPADKKITISDLRCMKKKGRKIAVLTAYDATFAEIIDRAGVHVVMVGDSLGMVFQGHNDTLPVTIEEMIYHTKAVRRGVGRAHIVSDMPFMSYQASKGDAIRNAGRLIKEGGAESVKIEGGLEMVDTVSKLVSIGIPVMGHIGLKPQSIHKMGGYKICGKTPRQAELLLKEAIALEEAGCYSIVLEGIAMEAAAEITKALTIPTIGISSGPFCDGQVLVIYDLLGMDEGFSPKFVKKYANLSETISQAVGQYIKEVGAGEFPREEHSFHMNVSLILPLEGGGKKEGVKRGSKIPNPNPEEAIYAGNKRYQRDAGAKR